MFKWIFGDRNKVSQSKLQQAYQTAATLRTDNNRLKGECKSLQERNGRLETANSELTQRCTELSQRIQTIKDESAAAEWLDLGIRQGKGGRHRLFLTDGSDTVLMISGNPRGFADRQHAVEARNRIVSGCINSAD